MAIVYFTLIAALVFVALRFTCGGSVMGRPGVAGAARIPIIPFGWALSLFLALTFVVCVLFDLIVPQYAMYQAWSGLLPGFVWLTPGGFVIGLIESFLYGWYVALIFGGLFNAISSRRTEA